jgi:predicted nucleic acid-binding Zn ribbon protein
MQNEYLPGSCNLGIKEIESRKRKALIGLILTILWIVYLQINHFTSEWRLIIFFPLFYSIVCFYQAQQKFCVAFGLLGIFNFGERGNSKSVADELHKKKDRKNAWRIIFLSLIFTLLIVVTYYLLPL